MERSTDHATLLTRIADAVAVGEDRDSYAHLARAVAEIIGVPIALIATVPTHRPGRLTTLVLHDSSRVFKAADSDLVDAPGSLVITDGSFSCPSGLRAQFPRDTRVAALGMDSYYGVRLNASDGQALGILALMDREALNIDANMRSIVTVFARQIALALERDRLALRSRKSDEHRGTILEMAPDAIITIDHEGHILSFNPAAEQTFGLTEEEARAHRIHRILPWHALLGAEGDVLETAPHDITSADTVGVRRDQSPFEVSVSVRTISTDDGGVSVIVARDLAEPRGGNRMLEINRQELEQASRLANMGHWIWNILEDHLELSQHARTVLGLKAGSSYRREDLTRLVADEDRNLVDHALARAAHGDRNVSVDVRITRPDKSGCTVNVRAELGPLTDGKPAMIRGTVQDITERVKMFESLRIFSSVVEQTADEVIITDDKGIIEFVNPAFENTTGYIRTEVIGKTPRVMKSGVHPKEFYETLWETIASGEVYRGVFVNRRKDGTLMWEEKTITPIIGPQGKVTHYFSTGRDITERKQAERQQASLEEELRLAASEWRNTFDAIEFLVVIIGHDGRVLRINRAAQEIIGQPFERVIGRGMEELPSRALWSVSRQLVDTAWESVEQTVSDITTERGRTWEISVNVHRESSDESTWFAILIARDNTRLRQLQESLRRNEMMSVLGALVAGVAHEVRNPLFAISATLDAFEGSLLTQDQLDEFATTLRAEVNRMSMLMQDLLEYGRPTESVLVPGRIEIAAREARQLAMHDSSRAGVAIVESALPDATEVMLDHNRLVHAMLNLIRNGIQHTPPGRQVSTRIEEYRDEDGCWIEWSVHDGGPGFSVADLPRIFEPFFTRRRGGTGLGLSIVQRIAEQHGGRVTAHNHPDDGGGVVKLRLSCLKHAVRLKEEVD